MGFARDFGYVMRLRCAIVLNSRDGFEETCPSIFRFTRKLGSRTKSSTENFKISSNALNFRASSCRQVSYGLSVCLGVTGMNKTIHAVFENGVFRPIESVDLPEKSEVEFELRLVAKKDAWPEGYFQQTAGAFANEPFERPSQGTMPRRDDW